MDVHSLQRSIYKTDERMYRAISLQNSSGFAGWWRLQGILQRHNASVLAQSKQYWRRNIAVLRDKTLKYRVKEGN